MIVQRRYNCLWNGFAGLGRILWFVSLAILIILTGPIPSYAAPVDDPKITKESGKTVLLLPDQFLTAVKTKFPDYRIPTDSDLTGLWASEFLPYITWGDFNGDGLTDIAVILIKEDAWREVIMHKTDQGYVLALDKDRHLRPLGTGIHSHQQVTIRRVPKDTVEASSGISFSHNLDSVLIGYSEMAEMIFFWKEGKYDSVWFGE